MSEKVVPAYILFPPELSSPQELTDYALTHVELYDLTPADLERIQGLVRLELLELKRLIPEQQQKAMAEVEEGGQSLLCHVWNLMYAKFFLWEKGIESEFPCGLSDKYKPDELGIDPETGFQMMQLNDLHLYREPDSPLALTLLPEELQQQGIQVTGPVELARMRTPTGEATFKYFLVTGAVQVWSDQHPWFSESLVNVNMYADYFYALSHFQIRFRRKVDSIYAYFINPRSGQVIHETVWEFVNVNATIPLDKNAELIVDMDYPALFMAHELRFQSNLRPFGKRKV